MMQVHALLANYIAINAGNPQLHDTFELCKFLVAPAAKTGMDVKSIDRVLFGDLTVTLRTIVTPKGKKVHQSPMLH